MARWTQTWLQDLGTLPARPAGEFPGKRLTLPPAGKDSVASWGRRLAAFGVDLAACALIGRLIDPLPENLEDVTITESIAPVAVLAVAHIIGLALVGQTPGMRLLSIRARPVGKAADLSRLGIVNALVRTALLVLFIPAIIFDRDRRGLHDRLAKCVVVRD